MKLLLTHILVAFCITGAMSQGSDFIFRTNRTIQEARIDSITAGTVYYRLPGRSSGQQKLSLKEITKIRFADGREQSSESLLARSGAKSAATLRNSAALLISQSADAPLLLYWLLDSLQNQSTVKGFRLPVKNLLFGNNSTVINHASTAYLDSLAQTLAKLTPLKFSVDGHTDNTGSTAANIAISRRRAKAVYDYLKSKGVDTLRMSYTGYGPARPAVPNTTAINRQRNRRVEITVRGFELAQPDRVTIEGPVVREVAILHKDQDNQILWVATDTEGPPEAWPMETVLTIRAADGTVTDYRSLPVQKNIPEEDPPASPSQEVVRTSLRKKAKSYFGLTAYLKGAYTIEPLSEGWADKAGPGVLQGFGGGIEYAHYLGKRIGLTLDVNYTQWKAVKRFMTEKHEIMYHTNS
ncbi:MAG: OmpA family protein, partial [Leadbetterella sp.]|nr:OmpA family protein [Leadbetterella sp.]